MKYRYANTDSGNLIDVLNLASSNRKRYGQLICPGCKRELLPVLGERRERHFRHKLEATSACTSESYLHALAKQMVVRAFANALTEGKPFLLKRRVKQYCNKWKTVFGFKCRSEDISRDIDLTQYFDQIKEESRVDGFVADVLLTSSKTDEKLLIEINVTHACEPEKLDSGLRIAEVKITTEDEAHALEDGITEFNEKTNFYNFRRQAPKPVPCNSECGHVVAVFHVVKSGKAFMQTDHPERVSEVMLRASTIYSRRIIDAPFLDFEEEALRALRSGVKIKVCSICRYAGFDTLEKPVFCKIKRKEVGNSAAATCFMYRPKGRPHKTVSIDFEAREILN